MQKANSVLTVLPDKMPGSEKDTPELVTLGQKLYFQNGLSVNDSQSCNSCHRLDEKLGGVDNEPTSAGALHKRGGRNAPTVLNAGFQFAQFWDGRAPDLKEQAKGPILNPIEMGMPDDVTVMKKVKGMAEYPDLFAKAYPDQKDPMTYDNLAHAIAAFERTLVTHDRLDDFLRGDESALSEAEKKGLDTFLDTGCVTCHSGPTLGGQMFQKLGLVKPYPTKDTGREEVTKNPADKYFFKVPMLRNIELTGPYFHDGSVKTLPEAVKIMAAHQLGKDLTDEQIASIVTFLKALTDKERAK